MNSNGIWTWNRIAQIMNNKWYLPLGISVLFGMTGVAYWQFNQFQERLGIPLKKTECDKRSSQISNIKYKIYLNLIKGNIVN